ncbi:peptidylprolyl isomerase [Candidatus Micrarchaeota archaeon]|nr:peptidylprolyl isomerase [Candidatus Micrarchaeota archaeon]
MPTDVPVSSVPSDMDSGEPLVKAGDVVSVDYLGRLENGTVFDTNIKEEAEKAGMSRPAYEPLQFQVGAGQMIAGFDRALVGMRVGETKTVELPPEEAYGEYNDGLIRAFPLSELEGIGAPAEVGLTVRAANGLSGVITSVNDTSVTIDFNHRLAGKSLIFDITLKSIQHA